MQSTISVCVGIARSLNRKARARRGDFRIGYRERKRLEYFPRYRRTHSMIRGRQIELTDAFWYLFSYREIFEEQTYKFTAESPNPFIVDCGANIGMSLIYFKYLYPDARIVAFEPDPEIFALLEKNVRSFAFGGVTLCQRAAWSSETELSFQPDGAIGGKVVRDGASANGIKVRTTRLRDYLDRRVDLLKIDIEGAELEVLRDCRDKLKNVVNLFVEHHGGVEPAETLDEMLHLLRGAGFMYHVKESYPVQHPFLKPDRNRPYPLQLNIFAFRD